MKRLILILVLVSSCAGVTPLKSQKTKVTLAEKQFFDVYNGKVTFISLSTQLSDGVHQITCKEQESPKPLIKSFRASVTNGVLEFFYAEGYHSQAKKHFCFIADKKLFEVNVSQFKYAKERLNVDQRRVVLSKKDKARSAREWHLTQKLYKQSPGKSFADGEFSVPLDSFITSHYGKKRIFNNLKKTQHLGNDFRAKVGTPIPASNRGKIVFAGDLFYTGNVVIIDHGLDIFTLYGHLSKINVKAGAMVKKGDIIGLSGKTGRVSGPHLHWGVKINGFNIDGFSLVNESKLSVSKHEMVN
ncbi:MAG: M23 family metallopeptidase [Halobacteriovoraceae bacterium]|nr:M23 family metallopeptidase [Halobacteriovoraceae bacterium]